jgi:putative ABC transport system permease protein
MVAAERSQIGMLKAIGYGSGALAAHYARIVAAIALAGVAGGAALGEPIGRGLARSYQGFYRFPRLAYEPAPDAMVLAGVLALAAALAGAAGAVLRAARLPPAEAMRPEPPASFRPSLPERLGLARLLSPAGRMALRNVARRPVRALLSALGLASAVAVLVVGAFSLDALDFVLELSFARAQRQDATVTFTEPASPAALHEIRSVPGVVAAEPFRAVAATLRSGHRSYRTAITGVPPGAELQRIVGVDGRVQPVPASGLVLSSQLARILAVEAGDAVRVEVLEGRRPARELRVEGTVDDVLGVSATLPLDALGRLLEDRAVSGAWIATDAARAEEAYARLRGRPRVAGVVLRSSAVESYRKLIAGLVLAYAAVLVGFAAAIAAGVVYNAARVTFVERAREAATLRVLGFTRGETFRVLAEELAGELAVALPVGCGLGWLFAFALSAAMRTDLYRIPVVVESSTYAFAVGVTALAAATTALALRRWVARLDLVEVLKSRE